MERHISKRLGIPCAVISAPVHVQDFPARYAPVMGFEGAKCPVRYARPSADDGLEEHLLQMFREDFEFHDVPVRAISAMAATPRRERRNPRRQRRFPRLKRCSLAAGDIVLAAVVETAPASALSWPRRRNGNSRKSLLRARQGAPQHRTLRRRARPVPHHRGHIVRCQGPFRTLIPCECGW